MNTSEICNDQQRRQLVQNHKDARGKPDLNGIDYVEVSDDDQCVLHVHFLGAAPGNLLKGNVRIEGGRRIRNICAVDPGPQPCMNDDEPEPANCLSVAVNQAGDFSTYTLRLVEVDEKGQATNIPLKGFDHRYVQAEFSFTANDVSSLDCQPAAHCPSAPLVEPEINYLAKDFASFRQLILDRLALLIPGWQERHLPDMGIMLVELLAYAGDYLSYYQDAVATEAYLETARQRISVRRHVRLIDYDMHEGCNARAWLYIETSADIAFEPRAAYFMTTPAQFPASLGPTLTEDDLRNIPTADAEAFEPLFFHADAQGKIGLHKAHNTIPFYTWGDRQCCLPCGATSASLRDTWTPAPAMTTTQATSTAQERELHLQPGDILYFEEVLGAKTGNAADADPTHRHIVRLTKVELAVDSLYDPPVPVLEIVWAEEDALPFPLCLSTSGPAPACELLEDVNVARGNVILVDAGRWQPHELLGTVEGEIPVPICEGAGDLADGEITALRFSAQLRKAPLTFRAPLPEDTLLTRNGQQPALLMTSAAALLQQDPRQAVPEMQLNGTRAVFGTEVEQAWTVRPDLLASYEWDYNFVVEMDDDGHGILRFGDGESGHMPEIGTKFVAAYRTGNGTSGNVGAKAISHIVLHGIKTDTQLKPSNPFPASGGTDPEPLAEVKLFAPHAFHANLLRAIVPDDYARLAERNPCVQRAAAMFRWTGGSYKILVAIDQRGKEDVDADLLEKIEMNLENYRCIGHELVVVPARMVPLDINLDVSVLPHYLRTHVKAELLDVFSNRILADGRRGFFYPDNLSFGESIPVSRLVAVAQAVPGVQSIFVTKLERLNQEANSELEHDILPIGPLEIAQLDSDRNFPAHGRLTITMRGGR